MGLNQLVCVLFVIILLQAVQAQIAGCSRSANERCPQNCPSCPSSSTCDLGTLLLLSRALDNPSPPPPANNGINADEIINKLINALVYTTTQSVGSGGNGLNRGYGNGNSGQGSNGGGLLNLSLLGGSGGANSGQGNNGDGLLGLNLLGAGPNNVLGLDVGGQGLLGLGLGSDSGSRGGNSDQGSGQGLLGLGGGNGSGNSGSSSSSSGSSGGTGTLGAVTGLVNGLL